MGRVSLLTNEPAFCLPERAMITKPHQYKTIEMDCGRLTWFASGELGNSATMTVGCSHLRPGQMNPRHFHPNCEEILHVLQGRIVHSLNDEEVEMAPGDTVSIPPNAVHNARNIGDTEAVLFICFSSADRQTVWV